MSELKTGEYIKSLSDEFKQVRRELDDIATELLEANCGEFDGAIGDTVKKIFGVSGVIGYVTDYMAVHAEEFKGGTFFEVKNNEQ